MLGSTEKYEYVPIQEPRSPSEMDALTQDEAILLLSQRQEQGSRASLVESLMRMGRWNEAAAIETDPENQAFILALKEGEEKDDSGRCECQNMVDVTDYVRMGDAIKEGTVEPELKQHPHYQRIFRHFSTTHGVMVWANHCHLCGHIQSIPGDIDELHAAHSEEQTRTMKIEYARPTARIKGQPR